MTSEQFDALTAHMGLGPCARTVQAARLILIDGLSAADAAKKVGLASRPNASNTAKRYRDTAQSVKELAKILESD